MEKKDPGRDQTITIVELKIALRTLCDISLTQRQKKILLFVNGLQENYPITRVMFCLKDLLDCSETTIWNNLRQLKKVGLVMFGDANTKGTAAKISPVGKVICTILEE